MWDSSGRIAAATDASIPVAPAAAAAAEAAASTTTAAAALGLGTRLRNGQGPAADFLAVQARDGRVAFRVVAELDEAETLRAAAIAVGDHGDGVHGPVGREQVAQIALARAVRKISHVQFHEDALSTRRVRCLGDVPTGGPPRDPHAFSLGRSDFRQDGPGKGRANENSKSIARWVRGAGPAAIWEIMTRAHPDARGRIGPAR